ncbi:MAG: hypothetical protein AVDCRST_MAG93-6792 [uncultured Chloroflexia bacterium]|uniref:Uncharacterized protein n=1 Tax=uncultured Chloroflexia bacterium TaxID=1672391 RepID=A0A6J4LXD1_9CHLR|nr:MAG: hypothetical protein AVDCRST_MAG93-6792 [uncultured Chloroflexia bacterium]
MAGVAAEATAAGVTNFPIGTSSEQHDPQLQLPPLIARQHFWQAKRYSSSATTAYTFTGTKDDSQLCSVDVAPFSASLLL